MTRTTRLLTLACLAAPTVAAADVPNVMTDFGPTRSIVASIMDGVGAPDVLLAPSDDPHHFSLRPSQARQLSNADIVVWVGGSLTPWLTDPLANLADDALTLSLLNTEGWEKLKIRGNHAHGADDDDDHDDHEEHTGHDDHNDDHDDHAAEKDHDEHDHEEDHDAEHADHDDHDHADHAEEKGHDDHAEHDDHEGHDDHEEHGHDDDHGDAHGEDHAAHDDHEGHEDHDDHAGHGHDVGSPDPHAWLDPAIVSVWVDEIAAALAAQDPENADTYLANAAAYQVELTGLGESLDAAFSSIDGDHIILPHDSFQYLEARTGVVPAAFITDSEDADPGPAHLRELREMVESGAVTCVVAGAPKDDVWVQILLENTDAKTALLDVTDRADAGYIAMMEAVGVALKDCAD